MRGTPIGATVYGIDLGKNTFHVVGVDATGKPIQKLTLSRATIFVFFAKASAALIGMEACPGSHWLSRKLEALGHTVRIIPAQFVKPYVKSNKNDLIDAAAIAEAVTRPTMRYVKTKTTEQVELQTMHRLRESMLTGRTRLVNQMRAFCLEFGITMRSGVPAFKEALPLALADENNDLTPRMRQLLSDLWQEFKRLDDQIVAITKELATIANRSEIARRLMTIPGIGSLGATAILGAAGDAKQFGKARDFAAWLGLVPAQYSTGGKTTLRGISKRGNSSVRCLLIHGARSCLAHMNRSQNRLGEWLTSLEQRMHPNKVVVALANKIARIVWVVLTKEGALYSPSGTSRG